MRRINHVHGITKRTAYTEHERDGKIKSKPAERSGMKRCSRKNRNRITQGSRRGPCRLRKEDTSLTRWYVVTQAVCNDSARDYHRPTNPRPIKTSWRILLSSVFIFKFDLEIHVIKYIFVLHITCIVSSLRRSTGRD